MPSRMLQRPLVDLIATLRRHVELLRVYAHHAFQERNELFLGEVAGKLRMLVTAQTVLLAAVSVVLYVDN